MEDHKGFEKESLKNLIGLIDEILKFPENEWFAEELSMKLGAYLSKPDLYDNSTLSILKSAISKDIIQQQGVDFYKDVRIADKIKNECIHDYIMMEHARRNNDFEGFAIALYQQLEGLSNYWLSQNNWDKKRLIKSLREFGYSKKNGDQFLVVDCILYEYGKTTEYLLSKYKYSNDISVKNMYFDNTVKCLIFVKVLNWSIRLNFAKYLELAQLIKQIRLVRNLVHRPKLATSKPYQTNEVNNILKNYANYFSTFYYCLNIIVNSFKSTESDKPIVKKN